MPARRCRDCGTNYLTSVWSCPKCKTVTQYVGDATPDPEGEEYELRPAPGRTITDERILEWRRGILTAAGFPYDHACELAADADVDLHEAEGLARHPDCGPAMAWLILAHNLRSETK